MGEDEEFTDLENAEGREELVSNDEANPAEAAFMKGYEDSAEEDMDDESEDKEYEEAFDDSED